MAKKLAKSSRGRAVATPKKVKGRSGGSKPKRAGKTATRSGKVVKGAPAAKVAGAARSGKSRGDKSARGKLSAGQTGRLSRAVAAASQDVAKRARGGRKAIRAKAKSVAKRARSAAQAVVDSVSHNEALGHVTAVVTQAVATSAGVVVGAVEAMVERRHFDHPRGTPLDEAHSGETSRREEDSEPDEADSKSEASREQDAGEF